MDNKQYITQLSRRATLNYKETQQLVSSAIATIIEILSQGDNVAIPTFGTFGTEKRDEYIDVDSNTGKRMLFPPSIKVVFNPGTILSKSISSK